MSVPPPKSDLILSALLRLAWLKRIGAFGKWDQDRVREPAVGRPKGQEATGGSRRGRGQTKGQRIGVKGSLACWEGWLKISPSKKYL